MTWARMPAAVVIAALLAAAPAVAAPQAGGTLTRGETDTAVRANLTNSGGEPLEFLRLELQSGTEVGGAVGSTAGNCSGQGHIVQCGFNPPWAPGQQIQVGWQTQQRYPDNGGGQLFVCPAPCGGVDAGPFAISGPAPPGTSAPPPPARRSCPLSPVRTAYDRHLDDIAYLRFLRRQLVRVKKVMRRARGARRRALRRYQRALAREARSVLRRVQGRRSQVSGLSQEDLNECLDELIAGVETMLRENGTDVEEDQVKELVGHLETLKKLLDPEQAATVSEEDKQKVLEEALIALVKQFGGEKAGELTGHARTLYDVLTGQLGEEEKTAAFRAAVVELAKKIDKTNGEELANVVFDLIDVLNGDLTPEKREELLRQHLTGFFTKIVGEGVVKGVYVRAFVTGYELMQPFANQIARNLSTLANAKLWERCMEELRQEAERQGLQFPSAGISAGPFRGNPQATAGWTCATFEDPTTGNIEIQAVSPAGGTVYIFDIHFPIILNN